MDQEKIEKILLPVSVSKTRQREKKVRTQFWSKFRSYAAQIPFGQDLAAAYYCATDKNTPTKVRAILLASLAYFILPMDTVPDILAFVGFSDDIAVLTAAITMVQSHITDDHRDKARQMLERARQEGEQDS